MRIPGIARHASEPFVSLGEGAQRELRYKYGSCFIKTLYHGGVFFDVLLLESGCAPGGAISLYREQVLRSPGQPMQGTAILAGCDLAVRLLRLCTCAIFGERDHELQHWI